MSLGPSKLAVETLLRNLGCSKSANPECMPSYKAMVWERSLAPADVSML